MVEDIHINGKGNILEILKQMKTGFEANSKSAESFQKTAGGSLDKVTSSLKNINLASLNQNIQNLGQGFEELNRPGLDFNSNLSELSALTGTTGNALDRLGEKARSSAKEFGGNATDSLNTYKTILSRLGPDIAKDQEALSLMEKNVQVLSKTMGGDATGAVDALTTAMLQYGVDLSNPKTAQQEMAYMMDVMANSAQEGAAEVPQISAALKVSGVAAKQANVSFVETNAALQELAKGGKEGAEAGMALRNVLGKMAGEDVIPKAAAAKLKALGVNMDIVSDTTLPFTDRLRELKKAQGDATVMAQVFGVENAAAAQILLNSTEAQDDLAKKIEKTGGAQAQANIVMESTSESLARMQANIDDAKISFFEMTGGMSAYLGPATDVLRTMTSLSPVYSVAKTAVIALGTAKGRATIAEKASTAAKLLGGIATKTVTAATWLWNAALSMNPVVAVTLAVAVLATGIYALSKAFDTSTASQRLNAEITKDLNVAMVDEEIKLKTVFDQLRRTNPETEERKNLIKDLKDQYPGLLDKYDLEKASLEDIDRLQKQATNSARARIEQQLNLEAATALEKEAREMEAGTAFEFNFWTEGQKQEAIEEKRAMKDMLLDKNYLISEKTRRRKAGGQSIGAGVDSTEDEESKPDKPILGTTDGYTDTDTKKSSGRSSGTVKSISIKIENLMSGDIVIQSTTISEGAAKIRELVTEALVGAVRDVEVGL